MKKVVLLVSSMAFAGAAWAGDWAMDGKDPHASGGCSSKAKIAKLKEMYGEDWARIMKQHALEEKAKAEQSAQKEPAADQFI